MFNTALYSEHIKLNAKMVDFAGYQMPIQYPSGIVAEHNFVRSSCGLFDVSHMGQIEIIGQGAEEFLSQITPTNFALCDVNQAKYTVLLNENGGIIDDLIILKFSSTHFSAVINAGTKHKDIAYIKSKLPTNLQLKHFEDKALIAIQGKFAEKILQKFTTLNLSEVKYMYGFKCQIKSNLGTAFITGDSEFIHYVQNDKPIEVLITRTGYTGEDGFEISIDNKNAPDVWEAILQNPEVKPIGLGARDSLRLEMGYPLYGHDIDDEISPIEAGLSWVVSKDHKNFVAEKIILSQKQGNLSRKRVAIKFADKIIAREGAEIYKENKQIGKVTSGGFSPFLNIPLAMGYVDINNANENNEIEVKVRDKFYKASITKFPFVQPRTKK
jgi:aminomethyltransferase